MRTTWRFFIGTARAACISVTDEGKTTNAALRPGRGPRSREGRFVAMEYFRCVAVGGTVIGVQRSRAAESANRPAWATTNTTQTSAISRLLSGVGISKNVSARRTVRLLTTPALKAV